MNEQPDEIPTIEEAAAAIVMPTNTPTLDKLERIVGEIDAIQSKLILLLGISGKTKLLRALGERLSAVPFNVGMELGHRLAATSASKRTLLAGELLREITEESHNEELLLLDNIEVLFEPSLKINPLDLIKSLAHSRRVVAVWPGEMRNDRLVYAKMEHPEHRDYHRDGMFVFEVPQSQQGSQ